MINPFKEIDWSPDRAGLRKFGWSLIIGFPILAVVFFLVKWISAGTMPGPRFFVLLAGIGAVVGVVSLLVPVLAKPLYVIWYGLAACIGIVMANLLFSLLFYGLFTPMGLVMRLTGRDPLQLKSRKGAASYWQDAPPTPPAADYFRQY
ncbi:MAG: hypothetical protein JNK37_09745 [Verrucomicrobiales bacterium]|nr:hypothetical protein [Verrucomicrobiales bacterium]